MLKKINLKNDDVVSVKVNEKTYTLAQMRNNGIMQFFDIARENDDWSGVDLNQFSPIFAIFVADKSLRELFSEKLAPGVVVPSKDPVPKRMLSAVIGNVGEYGANLIELTEDYSSYGAEILKSDINPATDLDLIYRYEMAGVQGDPAKIRKRLQRYFDTGVNWDDSKSFIFKDVPLPPSSKPTARR